MSSVWIRLTTQYHSCIRVVYSYVYVFILAITVGSHFSWFGFLFIFFFCSSLSVYWSVVVPSCANSGWMQCGIALHALSWPPLAKSIDKRGCEHCRIFAQNSWFSRDSVDFAWAQTMTVYAVCDVDLLMCMISYSCMRCYLCMRMVDWSQMLPWN